MKKVLALQKLQQLLDETVENRVDTKPATAFKTLTPGRTEAKAERPKKQKLLITLNPAIPKSKEPEPPEENQNLNNNMVGFLFDANGREVLDASITCDEMPDGNLQLTVEVPEDKVGFGYTVSIFPQTSSDWAENRKPASDLSEEQIPVNINQKRIPDLKKNRSWTQFVQNKAILEEFRQICNEEGCTNKKQIVDEFWLLHGNELDGKKSGLYVACCNNEKANKFLEQTISEHKMAK